MTISRRANVPTAITGDPSGPATAGAGRVTQPRVLRSEWIKLRSLRSTMWALLASALAVIGGGAFSAVGILVRDTPPPAAAIAADPAAGALSGVGLAQLAMVALGVLVVTGEYRSRVIRSSLTAVPTRLPLVWGKALMVTAVSTVLGLAALLLSFLVARLVVATEGLSVSLSAPGVARALIGSALVLGVTAALATGFGWLLRNTATAVFTLLAVLYVVPSLAQLLPRAVAGNIMPFLPSNAVAGLVQVAPVDGALHPWAGLAVYAGYAVLSLAAGALLLTRRDG